MIPAPKIADVVVWLRPQSGPQHIELAETCVTEMKPKVAVPVVALRYMRGYSAAKHDGKSDAGGKTLRPQIGQIYDVNLDRNM